MITRYQELKVWQKAIDVVEQTYILINKFPKNEVFALADQIKRAAIYIPSNIAEGSQRGTKKENVYFLHIAKGSAAELETQYIIAERLHFITKADFDKIHDSLLEILKMLSSYISYHKTNL